MIARIVTDCEEKYLIERFGEVHASTGPRPPLDLSANHLAAPHD